jgi:transposase
VVADANVNPLRQGIMWRALPPDIPRWISLFWYLQEWRKDGTQGRVEDACDARCGPPRAARGGVADSLTARATGQPGRREFDGERATG